MIAITDESAAGGKSAKPGKEGKGAKESKKAAKDEAAVAGAENKNAALLRQLATDLAAVTQSLDRLQSDVDALKREPAALAPAPVAGSGRKRAGGQPNEQILSALKTDGHAVAAVAIQAAPGGAEPAYARVATAADLGAVDSSRLARVGYAFSSAPKIALLRLLLDEGEQTAAQLGEKAGLTTGSLYHHLRELVHCEVAHQSHRNRYALTAVGRRTLLALLMLAEDEGGNTA